MEEELVGVKISELPQASAVGDNDVVAGVVNGETSKIPASLLKGQKGDPGAPGAPGDPGVPGAPGESAYQIAVDNGFTGTEEEWLESLVGPQGKPGTGIAIAGEVETYADLPNDLTADDAGKAYIVRADGKLYIWSGTAFPAEGQGSEFVGPKGDPGNPGKDGENGESAYQIAVDNGFKGTEAEWLASLKGEPGKPGEPGKDGSDATVDIVQETGASTTSVMSQKAVTDTINNTSETINDNVAQNTTAINNEVTARENAVSALAAQVQTDLANYYTKSETYSQTEVNEMVSAIPKFAIQVVDALPTENISTTTVYLVKSGDDASNLYTEYIYVDSKWEQLGTQTVDLTGYLTETTAEITYVPLTRTVNGQPLTEDINIDIPSATEVVQNLGQSTTAVMSQKAVSDTVGDIQTVLESI